MVSTVRMIPPLRRHCVISRRGLNPNIFFFSSVATESGSTTQIRAFIENETHHQQQQQSLSSTIQQQQQVVVPYSAFSDLTRTAVHRMRVSKLREELIIRGLDTKGSRTKLVNTLLDALEQEKQYYVDTIQSTTSTNNENIQILPVGSESHEIPTSSTSTTESSVIDPKRQYILRLRGIPDKKSNGTGIGVVIMDEVSGTVLFTARKYLPCSRTLFEAEYTALIMGLRFAYGKGITNVTIQLDQSVVMNHLTGKYPVEKETLKVLYWQVISLKDEAASFDVEMISKLENVDSEELAHKALATGVSINFDSENNGTDRDPMDKFLGVDNDNMDVDELSSSSSSSDPDNELLLAENTEQRNGNSNSMIKGAKSKIVIDPSVTYLLQFDGGARGNPSGKAGAGMVLYDSRGNEVWCGWKFLGSQMSNNQAEYYALQIGLKCAHSLGIKKLRCEGDSDLIVKQVNGIYEVRSPGLKELYHSTVEVVKHFDVCELHHIFREKNKRADWLANNAMDLQSSYGFDEV